MNRLSLLLVLNLILLATLVTAQSTTYDIIVNDNGESLVFITINGSKISKISLPEDVVDVRVKGALYLIDNNTLELSMGSSNQAVVLYRTIIFTTKQKKEWSFTMSLPIKEDVMVTLNLPEDVLIHNSYPMAFFDNEYFKKIRWEGNIDKIQVDYSYSNNDILLPLNEVNTPNDDNYDSGSIYSIIFTVFGTILSLVIVGTLVTVLRKKISKASESKNNVIKTLSNNEATIVKIALDNEGNIKRNELERKSKIAKSSLASSLNNLEKKNILEIDKTYTSHFVRLTKWFTEL